MARSMAQARAVAQVVGGLKHDASSGTLTDVPANPRPLRVVNGMPSTSTVNPGTLRSTSPPQLSPTIDSALVTPTIPHPYANPAVSAAPSAWHTSPLVPPGLTAHPEEGDDSFADDHNQSLDPWAARRVAAIQPPLPAKPRVITPSLPTLEKAVSARIYFENLYFALLRQKPAREQRRLAMEKEMNQLGMSEMQKSGLRERWRRNETEYLRERRAKVDVNAFVKLKTIGHGTLYLPLGLYCLRRFQC